MVLSGDAQAGDDSRAEWRRVRRYLIQHRHRLTAIADELYPNVRRVGRTRLLTRPEWIPARPLDLDDVALVFDQAAGSPGIDGTEPPSAPARPLREDGGRYGTYAEAVAALAPPAVFEDRPTYRLLTADLTATSPDMDFASGSYFAGMNVGEVAAHELAAAERAGHPVTFSGLPFRNLVGDPTDLSHRCALVAISTLTLRYDKHAGTASFILHWRDPSKVAHGGGLYQVMPVGVFQPSADSPANERNDFDLWRCMVREFAEEFLGQSEDHGNGSAAIDYQSWPLHQALVAARHADQLRVRCLGLGVDPLTFAVDLITVAVFEATVFDEIFRGLVDTNAEGRVINGHDTIGIPFTQDSIEDFVAGKEPMQPAGTAALSLAWERRQTLLAT